VHDYGSRFGTFLCVHVLLYQRCRLHEETRVALGDSSRGQDDIGGEGERSLCLQEGVKEGGQATAVRRLCMNHPALLKEDSEVAKVSLYVKLASPLRALQRLNQLGQRKTLQVPVQFHGFPLRL